VTTLKAYAISSEVHDNQIEILYGAAPTVEFRYPTREQAIFDCLRLNQIQCAVGSHCCAFAVDQLPEGDFGIICACHPFQCSSRIEGRYVHNNRTPDRL
jgi:hypothetical protein